MVKLLLLKLQNYNPEQHFTMHEKELEFIVRRGLTDNAPRKLSLNSKFIQFQSNDLVTNLYTTFDKKEIVEFRFGMKWITFTITIGREYFIYIRNNENKILKINFRTYFGRKKNEYHHLFSDIIQNIRKIYFDEIVFEFIKKHENKENFAIGDVKFNDKGITIKTSGILNVIEKIIDWNNIRIKSYITYFSIYSSENPININRGFSYLDDWNTYVLFEVIGTILNTKGIENYQ